ncbi:MAG TPA: hypothetical protein VF039_01085 [Longimicrobiales bacterium]
MPWNQPWHPFRGSGATQPARADAESDDALIGAETGMPSVAGLRGITAPIDKWFALEVHALESEAKESAGNWAQAGIPRQDAIPEGELPPEQALHRRASEIFTQWVQKTTTRVQDAIEAHVQRARQSLNDMTFGLEEIRRAKLELADIDTRSGQLEAGQRGRESSFGFKSYWAWWWFIPAIVLLVAVDWVANVPVFQELLPQDADINDAWAVLAAEAETHGAWAGLYRMWYRIALSPEVAILALGVIVFLVVLAHVFGESVRRIVSVHERDVPEAGRSVRQYRRQFWIPAGVGLAGGALVVAFLFLAREQIHTFAQSRLTQVNTQIEQLDGDIAAATQAADINAVATLTSQRPALVEERAVRQERVAYAERIQATNGPIAILNAVLFLTAALLGYLKVRDNVTAPDPQDPRLLDLRHRRQQLRDVIARDRERVREADRHARESIAWAEFLAQSKPFEDWAGRRDRLARTVPLFRAENARLRGIDPHNIAAFRVEPRFEAAVPEAHNRFRLPLDFAAVKERHLALNQEWAKVDEKPVVAHV